MPLLLNRAIRLFLDGIGRRDEYEYYLGKFQSSRTAAFSILCPEPTDFETVAPLFTFDLSTLQRLDLFPVTLLCGHQAEWMQSLLVAEAHPYEARVWQGDPDAWNTETVEHLLAFVNDCKARRCSSLLVMPRQTCRTALEALIPRMARRLHLIRPRGPIRQSDDKPVFFYYTARPEAPQPHPKDQPLIELATALLERHPGTHISVCSPFNLLEELFTVKGAGCIIRKGSLIDHYTTAPPPDQPRLLLLLEESFGRQLARKESLQAISESYIERHYRGAALLESTAMGSYLSKFAVGMEARGSGLAQELWEELIRDHQRLFWRAHTSNPVNQWYERHADGYHKTENWRVFWRGIQAADVSAVIQYSLERPEDFL